MYAGVYCHIDEGNFESLSGYVCICGLGPTDGSNAFLDFIDVMITPPTLPGLGF